MAEKCTFAELLLQWTVVLSTSKLWIERWNDEGLVLVGALLLFRVLLEVPIML